MTASTLADYDRATQFTHFFIHPGAALPTIAAASGRALDS